MFNTTFRELPIKYYSYNDAIESLISDTLNFTGSNNIKTQSYTIKEEVNNLVFDCLAPSIEKNQIEINVKNNYLMIKTLEEASNLPYFTPINFSIKLNKDINPDLSIADLKNGVLKITMPFKECSKEKKISFK